MNSADTGDRTWGHLADTELFGRISDSADYILLSTDDLKDPQYHDCTQACHCMIFARNLEKIFNIYSTRASVLMQMRFDGYLGFPGGLVDPDEDHVLALNREMYEEMNLDLKKHSVTQENHVVSHFSKSKKLCLHFYALEVTLKELHEIEKNCITAKDYGHEVLGTVRVPLYTMGDGFRGFPTFLTNAFIGNARLQLLYALKHFNILTDEEIRTAEQAKPVSSIVKEHVC